MTIRRLEQHGWARQDVGLHRTTVAGHLQRAGVELGHPGLAGAAPLCLHSFEVAQQLDSQELVVDVSRGEIVYAPPGFVQLT